MVVDRFAGFCHSITMTTNNNTNTEGTKNMTTNNVPSFERFYRSHIDYARKARKLHAANDNNYWNTEGTEKMKNQITAETTDVIEVDAVKVGAVIAKLMISDEDASNRIKEQALRIKEQALRIKELEAENERIWGAFRKARHQRDEAHYDLAGGYRK